MGDYFKPWRRRTGVVTLVFACVFMGLCVRSTFNGDYLQREWGLYSHVFMSANGEMKGLSFKSSGRFRGNDIGFGTSPRSLSKSFDATTDELRTINVQFDEVRIPYLSITIPLALLSAFLLLYKPRKSTSKKFLEPCVAEGVNRG